MLHVVTILDYFFVMSNIKKSSPGGSKLEPEPWELATQPGSRLFFQHDLNTTERTWTFTSPSRGCGIPSANGLTSFLGSWFVELVLFGSRGHFWYSVAVCGICAILLFFLWKHKTKNDDCKNEYIDESKSNNFPVETDVTIQYSVKLLGY